MAVRIAQFFVRKEMPNNASLYRNFLLKRIDRSRYAVLLYTSSQ